MGTMVRVGTKVQIWAACLLLAFPAMAAEPGVAHPEVDTALGRVGLQVGVKGTDRRVNVFLGIPFAQAPQGPGQFSAPCPAQSWEGVRDASTALPMCLQEVKRMNNFRFLLNDLRVFFISEDCLILNIYSPAGATTGAGRPLRSPEGPVMVWMHGGLMMVGAATSQDGSALAAFGDVVVVTIQYLSTGARHGPGNWAFPDVVAALHWVQGNITPFGGNPNCITVFGESAGSLIVSALVLSLLAAGLFHRAIAQSGIITFPGILDSDSLSLAQDFADSLACSSNSTAEMLQCLRQKTGEEMILTKESRQGWGILDQIEQTSQENILTFLRPTMTVLDLPPELWLTVIDEYLGNTSDPWTKPVLICPIMLWAPNSDPAFFFANFGVPIFFYEFHHRPSSFVKIKPDWVRADHGAELAFMFGGPFLKDESSLLAFPEATEEEKYLRLTIMAQWTQFARTGDPSGEGLPYWPLFNQLEQYLEVSPVPWVGQKLREAQMKFWAETLPTKIRQWQQKQKCRKAQEEL
ncbi:LOW QUALITY PROTEIN: carboxylesterase 3 [Trichechus inunguis]